MFLFLFSSFPPGSYRSVQELAHKSHPNSYFSPSFSIGVWEPQKSFWLVVLFLHVPARLFFGVVCQKASPHSAKIFTFLLQAYKAHFELGQSEYKQRSWYPKMVKAHLRLILVEIFGLVAVSIVDIENHFGEPWP